MKHMGERASFCMSPRHWPWQTWQVLRECDTTRDFCHEQKQQAVAEKSLEVVCIQQLATIGEKKHGFSQVLAGFRGLITKFREEFGFPSAKLPGTSLFGINSCHRQVGEIHDQLRHELKEAVSNVAWQPAVQL